MYNVLVTGGGKGLGSEISKAFAKNGHTVFINYLSDEASATDTKNTIVQAGGKAEIVQADVGNKEEIDRMMGSLPGIDVVIHNAVYPISSTVEEITSTQMEKAISVNALAMLYIAQHAFPHMKEKGFGRIFGISSSGSKRGIPYYIGVGTGKATMEALIRYMAAEWGPYGINANTVSPGIMDTEALRSVFPNADEKLEYTRKRTPRRETVTFEQVAELMLQLIRPEMNMITGQEIKMDGGFSIIPA